MHYYTFNIGDYRKDTVHLSPVEHYIYRSLIDWYYMDEKPIPKKTQGVLRRLGLGSDGLSNLQNVLDDFFEETENGWIHARIERDIKAFQGKRDLARTNGKKGGRPRKQQLTENEKPRKTDEVFLANPTLTHSKPNHKPITNNQIKKNKQKKKNEYPPEFESTWQDYPKRAGGNPKDGAFNAWKARINQGFSYEQIRAGVQRYALFVKATGKEHTEYVKQAKAFFGPDEHFMEDWTIPKKKPNGSGSADDLARAYQAQFGKPPPVGKSADEVRQLLAQSRDTPKQWWDA